MDAHAHLLSLGWAGPGHSLDSRPPLQHKGRRGLAYDPSANTGRGLVKPLLISQKKNNFGIGKKVHEPAAGNEWWLKGFEDALSNIGKGGSTATSGTATPDRLNVDPKYRGKHTGLYGFFVKGQQMKGTMDDEPAQPQGVLKRKSDTFDDESISSSRCSSRPSSPQKRKGKRAAKKQFEQIGQFMEVLEKDRKQPRKPDRIEAKDEFAQVSNFLAIGEPVTSVETDPVPAESKEGRRRRRKAEKKGRLLAQQTRAGAPIEDDALEAARKAERKKRKQEKLLVTDKT